MLDGDLFDPVLTGEQSLPAAMRNLTELATG